MTREEARKIQIGDVFLTRNKEIIRIWEIDDYREVVNNEPDGYCSERHVRIDDIDPIPLTAEILEKNGFKLLKCKTEIQSDNFIITFYGNHLDIIVEAETEQIRISKNIRYVHELQHALRLCGLNELADNFKI